MKQNVASRVVSAFVAVFVTVAIFVMYAPAFNEDVQSVRGDVFTVMFGTSVAGGNGYSTVWPLVIGFVLLLLAFFVALAGLGIGRSGAKIVTATETLLTLAAGILFLFAIPFYSAANAAKFSDLNLTGTTSLGAGTICVVVFSFLAAATGLLGFFLASRKED